MDDTDIALLQSLAREAWDVVNMVRPDLVEHPAPWFIDSLERLEHTLHVADTRGLLDDEPIARGKP